MTGVDNILRASLARCDRVVAGIDELAPDLTTVMPLGISDLAALTRPQRTAAVAFLKRYEQLQDLVARLARAIVAWDGGDAREFTNRDLADWAEKRGFVAKAETWMAALVLRNRLVHEYPTDEAEQVARVNDAWATVAPLRAALDAMRRDLSNRGFVE